VAPRRIDENTEIVLQMISGPEQFRQKISVVGGQVVFIGAPAHGAAYIYYSFGDGEQVLMNPNLLSTANTDTYYSAGQQKLVW
jgi:hypothetical protein